MKFLCEGLQKLKPEQIYMQMDRQTVTHIDRQTDRQIQTDRQTHSHDWKHYLPTYVGGKKEKVHLSTYDTNVIQLGITNNKMATPAPVQLQLPLTVSGLVFLCIRLWRWINVKWREEHWECESKSKRHVNKIASCKNDILIYLAYVQPQ